MQMTAPHQHPEDEALICMNVPEDMAHRDPHTIEQLVQGAKVNQRATRIATEFDLGLKFLRKYPKSVTIYGSARFDHENPHYIHARTLSQRLAKLGYAVITGGGPGIMEAANRGAKEAGGNSIGLNIELPREQFLNSYTTDSLSFYYFFSRKTALSFSAESYIYYPGGFGTLDEFFEIITLIQTKKIREIPIILVGSDFWKPLEKFILEECVQRHAAVSKYDMELYTITDDIEEILTIVQNAQVRS
jgi:uncharacterized protein (TIGR00730 family)